MNGGTHFEMLLQRQPGEIFTADPNENENKNIEGSDAVNQPNPA
jgi:hypothetical protein